MRIISILLISIFLVGCATKTEYVRYPIPVPQVPAPPTLERPSLPIHNLTMSDLQNPELVLQSYVISVRLLINYSEANEAILRTYTRLAERTSTLNDSDSIPLAMSAPGPSRRSLQEEEIAEQARLMALSSTNSFILEDAQREFARIEREYMSSKEELLGELQ